MFGQEDYQALFTELGGEPAAPAADPTPADPAPAEPAIVPENNPTTDPAPVDPAPAEPTAEPTDPTIPPATPKPEEDEAIKSARAFAELRATNNKHAKVFKQLQGMMGVSSEDEVIERLLTAGLGVQARQQNIDPEVLKRINTLEEQNFAMVNEQRQKTVVESFGILQKDFNLTNQEVMDFAKELDSKKIDIMTNGADLSTLYRGFHHDAIIKRELEAAKQKWITESAEANKAPGVTNSVGKKNPNGKTEIKTMGELDSLFKTLQNDNK